VSTTLSAERIQATQKTASCHATQSWSADTSPSTQHAVTTRNSKIPASRFRSMLGGTHQLSLVSEGKPRA
jgi:hypothetical protein